mmetsp:Transcript_38773/g.54056  ORF Transcript_38773/g.54056 Transcript_38773/m.54056 type:complete len:308 (-) Transcript_38773:23-946(-)|eukprot:CAMPEP_0201486572 /NCGR_PEP_ID=MMETSP0151_2-20130828/10629_1 /ASSEMBLY_ACC=CAM_ASM_000257 /TAXON_ID=200890 /ORGANISM="Paramoeba atlantica, Strain 621/1 / CCAP 1560/9" /LENGTH=307 /DNA_ID=CAMNT_0047871279 /DNA_START=131 /DNA_END=1054 /DNA_ORIENTATION=+
MVETLNARILSTEEMDETTTKWEIQNSKDSETRAILTQKGSFKDLLRGVQNSFNHFSLVRLSYLDDEDDVIEVETDDELVEAIEILSKSSAPAPKGMDEKALAKLKRQQEQKAKRSEALRKRDNELEQRIDGLAEKIVALQQRKHQLEENRQKVQAILAELEGQQPQEKKPVIVERVPVPTPTPRIEFSSNPQLIRLRNQEEKVGARLTNLKSKEKKSEKMVQTEKVLTDRLEGIKKRIAEVEKNLSNPARQQKVGVKEPVPFNSVQLKRRQQCLQRRLESMDEDSKVAQNLRKRLASINQQLELVE